MKAGRTVLDTLTVLCCDAGWWVPCRAADNFALSPSHTRREDITALKAKRLNEKGKLYFLESTYTQITETFLARLAAHG